MKPKSIITANNDTLPIVIKFYGKVYIVKSTIAGGLHMGKIEKDEDKKPVEIDLYSLNEPNEV